MEGIEELGSIERPIEGKTRKRGANWQSWEDGALAKEVTGVNPLTCEKGKTSEKWEEVAMGLKKVSRAIRYNMIIR